MSRGQLNEGTTTASKYVPGTWSYRNEVLWVPLLAVSYQVSPENIEWQPINQISQGTVPVVQLGKEKLRDA